MKLHPLILGAFLVAAPASAGAQEVPTSGAGATVAFWETVGDTTLSRLIRQALSANGDVQAAAARVDRARAARTESAFDLAPTVTGVASYSRQRLALASVPGSSVRGPDYSYWDAGIEASWELDVFGRVRGGVRGRSALLEASVADEDDVRVLVAAELARSYVAMRGLQEQLAVARENAANQDRTLALTRRRLEAGRGNELDTERAQAQLSLTQAAAVELESRVAAEQYRIATLAGREPDAVVAELEPPTPFPALPDVGLPADVELLARRRPDVVSAERQAEAAAAFHRAAKADYLPRLSFVGGLGVASNQFDRLGGNGTSRFAFGPVISLPLLNIGRVKARASAAGAERAAAEARHQQAVREAGEEVRSTIVRYRSARERLALLEQAATSSRRASALARLRFESGAADFLQVLDADRTRLAAEGQLARGRAEAGALLVAVYRATGAAAL